MVLELRVLVSLRSEEVAVGRDMRWAPGADTLPFLKLSGGYMGVWGFLQ